MGALSALSALIHRYSRPPPLANASVTHLCQASRRRSREARWAASCSASARSTHAATSPGRRSTSRSATTHQGSSSSLRWAASTERAGWLAMPTLAAACNRFRRRRRRSRAASEDFSAASPSRPVERGHGVCNFADAYRLAGVANWPRRRPSYEVMAAANSCQAASIRPARTAERKAGPC